MSKRGKKGSRQFKKLMSYRFRPWQPGKVVLGKVYENYISIRKTMEIDVIILKCIRESKEV